MLEAFARRERDARVAGAFAMSIGAAAAITAGVIADSAYDRWYGKPLWIAGIVVGAGGIFGLFRHGQFERLAHDAQVLSPEQLKTTWAQHARVVRMERRFSGIFSMVLGAAAIGTGSAIAAGVGHLKGHQRQDWTVGLIALGGGAIGSGLASELVESPIEAGYRAAYGSDADACSSLAVGVAPTVGGAALSLHGAF